MWVSMRRMLVLRPYRLENPEARQEAAIRGELRSRAETRPGACEKGREFGDLPGVTEASKGHWFGKLAVHFLNTPSISIRLCKVFLHRRDDRPRADRVCANVVLGQVHGQSVGKRNDGAFRSRVGADAGRVRSGLHRSHGDNRPTPAGNQVWYTVMARGINRLHVEP